MASKSGVDNLFTMMPLLVVLFSGTFVTTIFWCGFRGFKNTTLTNYVRAASSKVLAFNYLFGLLAGLLWFSQFILYGMGKSKCAVHFYIVGDINGADNCICYGLGIDPRRMERKFKKSIFIDDFLAAYYHCFVVYDWNQRGGIEQFKV